MSPPCAGRSPELQVCRAIGGNQGQLPVTERPFIKVVAERVYPYTNKTSLACTVA
jgi:hypothetical protein